MKHLSVMVILSVLLGAGCEANKPPEPPRPSPVEDPSAYDMPGVPYGTYQKAKKDIDAAAKAEQQWGASVGSE